MVDRTAIIAPEREMKSSIFDRQRRVTSKSETTDCHLCPMEAFYLLHPAGEPLDHAYCGVPSAPVTGRPRGKLKESGNSPSPSPTVSSPDERQRKRSASQGVKDKTRPSATPPQFYGASSSFLYVTDCTVPLASGKTRYLSSGFLYGGMCCRPEIAFGKKFLWKKFVSTSLE